MIEFPDTTLYDLRVAEPPPSGPQLYYVKHWPIGDPYRDGRPEVVPMMPVHKSYFDKDWQEFYFALTWRFWSAFNYDFAAKRWTSLNGDHLALMNRSGFPGDPLKANYITGENLDGPLPAYDKTRTMGGNVVTGYEMDGLLYVETLNGNSPTPDVDWVLERPWYYFHCVLAFKERVGLFPQGCVSDDYIWQPTIAPLVSCTTVALDLSDVVKLPLGSPIPDPYVL